MKKRTKLQKIRQIESHKDSSSGEHSPYWEHVGKLNMQEQAQANPDVLPETEYGIPSTPQLILGEAIEHLQGRQREVYLLTMREDKSFAEAAEILNISKSAVQMYKNRAVKFLTSFCEQAISRGRV